MSSKTEKHTKTSTRGRLPRVLVYVGAGLAVVLFLVFVVAPMIAASWIEGKLEEATGLRADVGGFALMTRERALAVKDIRLTDPAMEDVPALQVSVLELHIDGDVVIRGARAEGLRAADGRSNLEAVARLLKERDQKDEPETESGKSSAEAPQRPSDEKSVPEKVHERDLGAEDIRLAFRALRADGTEREVSLTLQSLDLSIRSDTIAFRAAAPEVMAFMTTPREFYAAASEIGAELRRTADDAGEDASWQPVGIQIIRPDWRLAWDRDGEDSLDRAEEFVERFFEMKSTENEDENEEEDAEEEDEEERERRYGPLPEILLKDGLLQFTVPARQGLAIESFNRVNASIVRGERNGISVDILIEREPDNPVLEFAFEGSDPLVPQPQGEAWSWTLRFTNFPWHVLKWPDRWDDDQPASAFLENARAFGEVRSEYADGLLTASGELRWENVRLEPDERTLLEQLSGKAKDEAGFLRGLVPRGGGNTPNVRFELEREMEDPNLFVVQLLVREAFQRAALEAQAAIRAAAD